MTRKRRNNLAFLEHINISVADGAGFADMLCTVFDWHIRWEGTASDGTGQSRHVGNDTNYIAVFEPSGAEPAGGQFNHLGVIVDELDAVEAKVKAYGLTPHRHADYEPGRRFYFREAGGVGIEVVQHA